MNKAYKKSFDRLADKLKEFELKHGNRIAELITARSTSSNKEGEEEYEEVEVPEWVLQAEKGKAWEEYLAKHGMVIDIRDPKNSQNSEIIFALFQQFSREWEQQPHPRLTIKVKKKWTEEEKAAFREQISKEKEEAARTNFGFDD